MSSIQYEHERVNLDDLAQHFSDRGQEAGVERLMDINRVVDQTILGDMVHEPIKKGAVVISVDGESDDEGAKQKFEKQSYLGRFVGIKMVSPDYYKILFTTRNGYYYDGTQNVRQRLIQNPLSSKGFYVPARNGYRVLDKGNILLVSRDGIFAQSEGYKQASRFLRDLSKERQRSDFYMSKLDETTIRLESAQEELNGMYLRNVSLSEKLRELNNIRSELITQRERADGMAKNLKAKAEYSQDVLEHNRKQLEEEVSKFSRYVSDVTLQIERINLEDTLRATRSTHPMLTAEFEKQLLHKWKREGLVSDNEVNIMEQRINSLQDELRRRDERDAYEEVDRQPTQGSSGDEEAGGGTGDSGGAEGLEQSKGKGGRSGGDGRLPRIISGAKAQAGKIAERLDNLRNRKQQQEEVGTDEDSDGEAQEGDE